MKPKIGIFGLSGCWGEQIVILNCEDQLLDLVGDEFRDLFGITNKPLIHRIYRWPAGNPQYDVGHLERVGAIWLTRLGFSRERVQPRYCRIVLRICRIDARECFVKINVRHR